MRLGPSAPTQETWGYERNQTRNVLYTRKSYLNFDLELEVRLSRRDNW